LRHQVRELWQRRRQDDAQETEILPEALEPA
jgi:hypothetical protein